MHPRPCEEWIGKGYTCFVYFAKGCGGWVFVGVNGVVWVDVQGRAVLSHGWDKGVRAGRLLIAKIEMAMRCMGIVGREVGVKCCTTQGCCMDGRPGVSSCWSMVQVAASTKTKRVGTSARQSEAEVWGAAAIACRARCKMAQEEGDPPPLVRVGGLAAD